MLFHLLINRVSWVTQRFAVLASNEKVQRRLMFQGWLISYLPKYPPASVFFHFVFARDGSPVNAALPPQVLLPVSSQPMMGRGSQALAFVEEWLWQWTAY